MQNIYKYVWRWRRLNVAETHTKYKREKNLGLYDLLGDFIEFYSSVETSLAIWSCSPGSNPINCGMPPVEKSTLVVAIHEKFI